MNKFDPVEFFESWAFEIKKAHWSAFGISLREYIEPEKTEKLREKWANEHVRYKELHPTFFGKIQTVNDLPEFEEWNKLKELRAKVKITYLAYAKSKNMNESLDFHEGDVFYLKGSQDKIGLQFINDGDPLEVLLFNKNNKEPSKGYHIPPNVLLEWLKTGNTPTVGEITPDLSKSELAKFNEYR